MLKSIQNNFLYVSAFSMGAELEAIRSRQSGRDFLWCGDPSVWPRKAPILFPVVGKLIDDRLKLEDGIYPMPKHGFAKTTEFTCTQCDQTSMTFTLEQNEATVVHYPFCFRLDVTYSLEGSALAVSYKITNTGDQSLPFSVGGHPGFACELGDKLVFSHNETALSYVMNENKYLSGAKDVFHGGNELVITSELFEEDALIFEGLNSDAVTLQGADYQVIVDLGGCPYLGIWAMPGAPYVCIEPWYGIDDFADADCNFTHKKGVVILPPSETFTYTYHITCEEVLS